MKIKLLTIFTTLALLYILAFFFIYKPLDTKYSIFDTLPIINLEKIERGYTLISPYNRVLSDNPAFVSNIYLLDLFGNTAHAWSAQHQALYSMLMPNANLLVVMELPKYSQFFPPGGGTGLLQLIDWNSKVAWEYKNESMHHAVSPLKNGNIAVALWEKTPAEIAARVQGGTPNTEFQGTMWSDEIAEINPKGEKVWSWHSYDHLDPQKDVLGPLMPRYAWTYTNGLSYMEKNPIDGSEGYLLSMRSTSTVYIVRKSDGEILWRSPKDMLNTQHDPTLLSNGHILVFDNGLDRMPNPFPIYGSRAVEIDPKTNKIVWKFDGGEGAIDKVRFFAPIVGGAQRLANENTLITDGPKGHIFEVTQKGEVVWDIVNPYTTHQTGAFPNNFLFRARRYTENEVKFPEGIAPAFNKTNYSLYQFLSKIYPK